MSGSRDPSCAATSGGRTISSRRVEVISTANSPVRTTSMRIRRRVWASSQAHSTCSDPTSSALWITLSQSALRVSLLMHSRIEVALRDAPHSPGPKLRIAPDRSAV